jgi:ElaB/YqjD/DUF883 family membrane-anchored ribosome-binding protein
MARNGIAASMEDRLDSLKESVRSLVDFSSHKMSDVKDTMFATGRTGARRAGTLIKEHPIIAISIAFGLGYLAVRMLRR